MAARKQDTGKVKSKTTYQEIFPTKSDALPMYEASRVIKKYNTEEESDHLKRMLLAKKLFSYNQLVILAVSCVLIVAIVFIAGILIIMANTNAAKQVRDARQQLKGQKLDYFDYVESFNDQITLCLMSY